MPTTSGLTPANMNTPTKVLHCISPVPKAKRSSRKRKKLLQCYRLTSDTHKVTVRERTASRGKKSEERSERKKVTATNQKQKETYQSKRGSTREKEARKPKKKNKNACVECDGVYRDALDVKKDEEWMRCPTCGGWMHESCFLSHDC